MRLQISVCGPVTGGDDATLAKKQNHSHGRGGGEHQATKGKQARILLQNESIDEL